LVDWNQYRMGEQERSRTEDLVRILPKGRVSVLDVGARDGHFSRILTQFFPAVTALDLQTPIFECPGVTKIAGDVTRLDFPDNSFDCVFCAEVLEHVLELEKACGELRRVAKHEIVIGVPYRQDIRVGRTTCRSCGMVNPPWGHLNSFNESRLLRLFAGLKVVSKSFVGANGESTNGFSALLLDLGGNPWGTYEQEEPCIRCGTRLIAPGARPIWQRLCSTLAVRLIIFQGRWIKAHSNWIHLVFSKDR
jgi:SAM-dependent methyltransferase